MEPLVWYAANGDRIEIEVYEHLDTAMVYASINGRRELQWKPVELSSPIKVGEETVVAQIGRIGLTEERYRLLKDMIDALQAEIDARPEVRMRKLIEKRQCLIDEINAIRDAAHDDHVRRVMRMSERGRAPAQKRDYAAEEQAALKALAEFDAAHPEVAREMERQRKLQNERFLAYD